MPLIKVNITQKKKNENNVKPTIENSNFISVIEWV